MSSWLVTGGAGYIGSHVARSLAEDGHDVTVVDNFSSGVIERIGSEIRAVAMDCRDEHGLRELLLKQRIEGIMHFAAFKESRVSVLEPLEYWDNNVGAILGTLKASRGTSVKAFVLSSSCSVYGSGKRLSEESPLDPQSPYAKTKIASEMIIADYAKQEPLAWCALRYFNVVGNADFTMAHDQSPYSLVPRTQKTLDEGGQAQIYGSDYPTGDGTAVRDYLDVRDLAAVHTETGVRLLDSDAARELPNVLNVGTGRPVSVREVVEGLLQLNGLPYSRISFEERKPGDPAEAWAETTLATRTLSWSAKYSLADSLASHVNSVRRSS